MSQLCVFTTGTNLDLLRASCERVIITLKTYDARWTGYVSVKLRAGIEFLKDQPESFSMWVDGNDSLILKPEEDILARLYSMGNPMVISAERACWPDSELSDKYPKAPSPQFINAGGFIGTKEQVLSAMHTVLAGAEGEDDQRAWTKAYLAGLLPYLQVDHSRFIFSSIADGEMAERADSCVKHWNGRSPGRKEYWDAITAIGVSDSTSKSIPVG